MKKLITVILLTIVTIITAQEKQTDVQKVIQALDDKIVKYEQMEGDIWIKMNEIDIALEKKLNYLIKHMVKARDSSQTVTQVIRNKKKIIGDLEKAQKAYKDNRNNIDIVFKTNTKLIGHDIFSLKKLMDDKINERIKQITTVTDSLAAYKEFYDGNWNNQYNDRRNVEIADREKNRVIKNFEKELKELNDKAKKIDDGFDDYSDSKERAVNTYSEMQTINERITLLEHSIEDILNGGNDGKKISKVAGLRLDKLVRQTSAEVNAQMKNFFYALNQYQRVLNQRKELTAQVNKLKAAISK